MPTTYVLGAGASKHAGYPLASELGPHLLDWLRANRSLALSDHLTHIEAVSERCGGLNDIEEILGELATSMDAMDAILCGSFGVTIPEFFDYLLRSRSSLLYRALAASAQPGDAIITFNYDLACERELKGAGLWEASNGYGFQVPLGSIPKSTVPILKLHGSANWTYNVERLSRLGQSGPDMNPRPAIDPRSLESLGYTNGKRDPLWPSGSGGYAALIVGRYKQFFVTSSWGPQFAKFWDSLWSQGQRALRTAAEIVIIGYSMPDADERARALLLGAPTGTAITVCCGTDSARIRDLFVRRRFSHVEIPGAGLFEDFLRREETAVGPAENEGDDLAEEDRAALYQALSASCDSAEAGRSRPASAVLGGLHRKR